MMETFLVILGILFVIGIISSWFEDRGATPHHSPRSTGSSGSGISCPRCGLVTRAPDYDYCRRCDRSISAGGDQWGTSPPTGRPVIPVNSPNTTDPRSNGPSGSRTRAPKPQTRPARPDEHDGLLLVTRTPDVWIPEGEPNAKGLPITAIAMSGDVYVDWDGFPVTITMRMFDITESSDPDRRYGIGCSLDGLHDGNGWFEFAQDLEIPYRATTLSDLAVGAIPDFALMLPKKGRRRVIVYVLIAPAHNPEEPFSFGSVEYDMEFDRVGYLEWEEHALEQEEHLVRVFVAASAVDEAIGQLEIDAVKEFFATRYEGRDDAKKWKSRASAALRSSVKDLAEKRTTPGRLLTEAAKAIRDAEEPEVSRTAYEVAVRAVAADGVVNDKEERLLTKLASALSLDDDVVRELRDRNLRASMFEHAEDESILGMPSGLSDDERRSWLSAEYSKWRGRVSHSNPDVAAEATIRLERIAKLRTTLS